MAEFPTRAQVVVVGGGIVGASVAYHLCERGWTDVVVLEMHQLTGGTTWHAAGLVGQLRATHNMTYLASYGAELYETLESEQGFPTGFKRTGSIAVASNEERLEELIRGADMARCFGVDVRPATVDELAEKWPLMNTDDLVGGVWVPRDGQTSPVDTTMALIGAAKRDGARVFENTRVNRILTDNGRAVGVDTSKGRIEAEYVVTAAGLWSRHLAEEAGASVALHACEHFYIVTEPIEGLDHNLPTLRDPGNNIYIKEESGRVLVGAFEPIAKPIDVPELPDQPFLHLPDDWDHLAPQIEAGIERLPILGEVGIRLFFNGPESFTPDDAYMLGETPELRNHFVAAGFNSVGIQSAAGAGRALADWIINGYPPMDLADVDVRRMMPFQSNRRYIRERVGETLGLLYEMHWPFRQKDTSRNVRRTPYHDRLVAAGACMGEVSGWERPNWYATGDMAPVYEYTYKRQNWFEVSGEEHHATRTTVGLFDQSSFAKFLVQGPDAMAVLNRICANEVDTDIGKVVYTQWLNERGGIEADLTVQRTAEDRYMVVTGAAAQPRDWAWLNAHMPEDARCYATDITSGLSTLGVMGPNARELLQGLTDADLSNEAFPFGTSQVIDLGYTYVTAFRLTYVGELGWELYIPSEYGTAIYDLIVERGQDFGLRHAGYHALNSLRMEKAYRHWGHDITDEDNPLQAGLNFAVAYDKAGGFIGREAMLDVKEAGVTRRLVQFRVDDPEPLLYHDEPIFRDGELVGHTTSGMYGYTVGGALGMGYVSHPAEMKRSEVLDADFELQINGERYPATASYRGFYDPEGAAIHS